MSSSSSSSLRLTGKRVLVTGGGRGIGQAIARICHAEGAKVAICARTAQQLQETADSLTTTSECTENNGNILTFTTDVRDAVQVKTMMQSIGDAWGGLDILINNAGRGQAVKGPVTQLDADELADLLQLNVVAMHVVTAAAVPYLTKGCDIAAQIVNISSRAGKRGYANMSHYVASKFAVEGLTAAWAEELLTESNTIRVNSFSPGMVNTASFPKPADRPGVRSADSIADALLFLLTGTACTGHYLHVDEFDLLVRQHDMPPSRALKPIGEPNFAATEELP